LQKSWERTRPGRRKRTASVEGLVEVFRNVDEHVRRLPPPASGGSAPHTGSRGRVWWSLAVEGTSIPGSSAALTCAGGNGVTRSGNRRSRALSRAPRRGVRGLESGGLVGSRKGGGGSNPTGARAQRWVPFGPKPAPCRQARSRRRPDPREVVRRRSRTDRRKRPEERPVPKSNAGGSHHGARRRVSGSGGPGECS
jgi:hypothetical protein